jgi:hypothetical protein
MSHLADQGGRAHGGAWAHRERPGTNAKDYPRIGIRCDAQRSKWVIALNFFEDAPPGFSSR